MSDRRVVACPSCGGECERREDGDVTVNHCPDCEPDGGLSPLLTGLFRVGE